MGPTSNSGAKRADVYRSAATNTEGHESAGVGIANEHSSAYALVAACSELSAELTIREVMAYTTIAGVPLQGGLYAAIAS